MCLRKSNDCFLKSKDWYVTFCDLHVCDSEHSEVDLSVPTPHPDDAMDPDDDPDEEDEFDED